MMRRPFPLERIAGLAPPDRGLTAAEARARRERWGPNDVVETRGSAWLGLARDTARDPMIWFLVGTSVLYALVGDRLEAATLLVAIAPLVGMDALLHRRTQASTEGLRSRLAEHAAVIRDGELREVPVTDVVPGDLAVVTAGESCPADGLVVDGRELQVDESALTGESYPVRKHALDAAPMDGAEPSVDAEHWGFAGTRLLTGRATLRVAYTGGETLYGEIARSAVRGPAARTPLQEAIAGLVSVLVAAAAGVCLILALVRLRQGYGWVDAVVSALTLAVAALPEEFPVVFTFFLGVGVYRLARRQALVRRAVSVENIGRVSAICSDKTGTITEGRLDLTHLVPAGGVSNERVLALAAQAARAESGDPLDVAILHAAGNAGASGAPSPVRVATFPFTEDRKRETAIVRPAENALVAVTKGAPETVLAMAVTDTRERDAWTARATALAEEGHKVIACAWRMLDAAAWTGNEPERGYGMAGLLAFEDPVRPGVADAVRSCRSAGIRTIMVTGDHPLTARAVARAIELGGDAPVVLSGDELAALLAHGPSRLPRMDVVARALPAQKLALVRALQAAGEIVAVTGDGVNDVPALQAADVGIAMGERGTRSAREVASIVLLDDNFRTIVGAIAEGRQLLDNLRRSFQYLLMIHIPLVATAALVPLAGYPLLYLPIHIVWLELIIHPTALLVFQELPQAGGIERAAPAHRARFFAAREWLTIVTVGTIVTGLVAASYLRGLSDGGSLAHARALALAALTGASATLAATLSGLRTRTARLMSGGTVALSILLVQTPALAHRLHMTPLHLDDLAVVAVGSILAVWLPLAVARAAR